MHTVKQMLNIHAVSKCGNFYNQSLNGLKKMQLIRISEFKAYDVIELVHGLLLNVGFYSI